MGDDEEGRTDDRRRRTEGRKPEDSEPATDRGPMADDRERRKLKPMAIVQNKANLLRG